jgi:hypothetical protein
MVEISVRCIRDSLDVVKMGKQVNGNPAVNAKNVAKPSKYNTQTTVLNPKPNK